MQSMLFNPQQFNPRILYILKRTFDVTDKMPGHSHEFLSLIYILNGEGQYNIGGKIYPLFPGTLFICNPNTFHHRLLRGDQKIEEFQVGIGNFTLRGLPANCLIPMEHEPQHTFNRYGEAFSECIREIMIEHQKNDEASVLMLKCLVMKLLVYIIKERYVPLQHTDRSSFSLERYDKAVMVDNIVSYIKKNYMKSVSLAKISENTYLSPIYVSKVFKETTGESPIHYLIRVRLAKACELFHDQAIAVKEIARRVGYEDAYYFSKLFKKYYGLSPLAYRKAEVKPLFNPIPDKEEEEL